MGFSPRKLEVFDPALTGRSGDRLAAGVIRGDGSARRGGCHPSFVLMHSSPLSPVQLRRMPRSSAFRSVSSLLVVVLGLLVPRLGQAQTIISGASRVVRT